MKLAINVLVGLAVGITLIAIAYLIIYQIDIKSEVDEVHARYYPEINKTLFVRMNLDEFIVAVADYRAECENNSDIVMSIQVESNGSLTKERMFSKLKNLSWCETIQSATWGCGFREDVENFGLIRLPAIVEVSCVNDSIYIEG